MIHDLARIYAAVFVIFSIFIKKLHITKKHMVILWGFFIFSLSVMAYYSANMPIEHRWDLMNHYYFMDQIRASDISFWKFIFYNDENVGGYEYKNLLIFNMLRYLVVSISEKNYLLPAICVIIDYSIAGYIIIDWSLNGNENYKLNLLTLLLLFTFMPYHHAALGLRNALSASIMGLAMYLYLYKMKKTLLFIILAFIAFTIHPVAIIAVPFVFLAKLNLGFVGFILVFAVSMLINPIVKLMLNSHNSFIVFLAQKYIIYTSETQYRGSRAPLYGVLIIITMYLLIYFLLYKRINSDDDNLKQRTIHNFFAMYMAYICGNIGNYDMVLRPAYVFGVLSPLLASFLSGKQIWLQKGLNIIEKQLISKSISFVIIALCIYVNYVFWGEFGMYF